MIQRNFFDLSSYKRKEMDFKKGDRIIWDSNFGYEIGFFEKEEGVTYGACQIFLVTGRGQGEFLADKHKVFPYTPEKAKELFDKYTYCSGNILKFPSENSKLEDFKMTTEQVDRFCELVSEINKLNNFLKKEKATFYHGGHPFEEVYKSHLEEKHELHKELRAILRPNFDSLTHAAGL